MKTFVSKLSKIAAQKKVFFFTFFTFEVPFNSLFAPIFRSWMSNIFRDLESLGTSNGNKWSQIWTFLFKNCLKSPHNYFFLHFFFTFEVPFNGLFAPTSRSRMSNIFRDSEFLSKSNGKKWVKIWTFLFGSGQKSPRKILFFLLILPWSTLLWHRCYYPHRSRDALSPVCGIFPALPGYNRLVRRALQRTWNS